MDSDGGTPLMWASRRDYPEVARLLCDAGTDKDKPDNTSFTPLMWASRNGHLEVARLLREAGATSVFRSNMALMALRSAESLMATVHYEYTALAKKTSVLREAV